jgi:hypothetical protein
MIDKKQPAKPKQRTIPGGKGGTLKPWPKGVSGNPKGPEPGTKHLSTYIREMMTDPTFEQKIRDKLGREKTLKGAPVAAILKVAIARALSGDARMMDILFEYGWGKKVLLSDADDKPIPILGGTAARPQRTVPKK